MFERFQLDVRLHHPATPTPDQVHPANASSFPNNHLRQPPKHWPDRNTLKGRSLSENPSRMGAGIPSSVLPSSLKSALSARREGRAAGMNNPWTAGSKTMYASHTGISGVSTNERFAWNNEDGQGHGGPGRTSFDSTRGYIRT